MLENNKHHKFTTAVVAVLLALSLPIGVITVAAAQDSAVNQTDQNDGNETSHSQTHQRWFKGRAINGTTDLCLLEEEIDLINTCLISGTEIDEGVNISDDRRVSIGHAESTITRGKAITAVELEAIPDNYDDPRTDTVESHQFRARNNTSYQATSELQINGTVHQDIESSGSQNGVNRLGVKRLITVKDATQGGEIVARANQTVYDTLIPSWDTFFTNAGVDSAATIINWWLGALIDEITGLGLEPEVGEFLLNETAGYEKDNTTVVDTYSTNETGPLTVTFDVNEDHRYVVLEKVYVVSAAVGINGESHASTEFVARANNITIEETGTDRSVEQVVASRDSTDDPSRINLQEIRMAVQWWANDEPVPGTGNSTLDLETIRSLVQAWANDESITPAT